LIRPGIDREKEVADLNVGAVCEVNLRDAPGNFGPQHDALARTQRPDGLRVVREGLKANDTIVVNGLQRVRPGSPVTPQTVAMGEQHIHPGANKTMYAQTGDQQ